MKKGTRTTIGWRELAVLVTASAVWMTAAVASAATGTPAERCQAGKAFASGKYYACLAKSEQGFVLKGDAAARTEAIQKCKDKLAASFAKLEQTAIGDGGACPTTGDAADVGDLLEGCSDAIVEVGAGDPATETLATCTSELATCEDRPHLPQTGQSRCYNRAGDEISCKGSGQDAELRRGGERTFTDNGDGTITDHATGLMWQKQSNDGSIYDLDDAVDWSSALTFVSDLNTAGFAGHTDWRLPNGIEMVSIFSFDREYPETPTFPAFDTDCVDGCTILTCSCFARDAYYVTSTFAPHDPSLIGLAGNQAVGLGFLTKGLSPEWRVRAVRGPL